MTRSHWFTSDLHLGHVRVLELSKRPYGDVDAMNRDIIARINERVAPDDTLWILGDVCLGTIADTLPLVSQINGVKYLVPGNHDRLHPAYDGRPGYIAKWTVEYEAVGLTIVGTEVPSIWLQDEIRARAHHFPYEGDHTPDDRYPEHRPVPRDPDEYLLHGHVHELWRQRGRQINVGVDAWGGYPVEAGELAQCFRAGEDSGPLEWKV